MGHEVQIDRGNRTEAVLCTITNLLLCVTWLICLESLYREDFGRILACVLVSGGFLLFEEWAALRIRNLAGYVVGHVVIYAGAIAALATDAVPIDILTLVFLVVMTGMGLRARLHEVTFFRPKWPLFASGILQFALGYGADNMITMRTGQISIGITAFLCIIWYNHDSIQGVLQATHSKATVPYEQIRVNNRFALLLSLGVAAVAMLPAVLLPFGEDIFRLLQQGLLLLIRAVVQLLVKIFGGTAEETASENSAQSAMNIDMSYFEETDSPLLEALWKILSIALAAASAALIVWLVWKFLKRFREDFHRTGQMDGDRIEYLRPQEHRKSVRPDRSFTSWLRGRTPGLRIRRMYQKAIRSGTGEGQVKNSHTPQELEEIAFGHSSGESGDQIHRIYEKARYGYEESTPQEALLMKEKLRELERKGYNETA